MYSTSTSLTSSYKNIFLPQGVCEPPRNASKNIVTALAVVALAIGIILGTLGLLQFFGAFGSVGYIACNCGGGVGVLVGLITLGALALQVRNAPKTRTIPLNPETLEDRALQDPKEMESAAKPTNNTQPTTNTNSTEDRVSDASSEDKISSKNEIAPETEIAPKNEIASETEIAPKNEIAPQDKIVPKNEIASKAEVSSKGGACVGGLPNFTNTCYLNAAIQGLLASPKFVRALQAVSNPQPLVRALQAVANTKDIPAEKTRLKSSLRELHKLIIADRTNPDLLNAIGTMQDSAAAFEAILGYCGYSIQLQTTNSAEEGLVESANNESIMLVHLPVLPNMSLQQISQHEYSPKQQNDPFNGWSVTVNQKEIGYYTQYTITRQLRDPAPELLVFQYQRMERQAYNEQKIECHPDQLLHMNPAGLSAKYRLVACINHHHPFAHYTADICKNNEWFHCSDRVVSKIPKPALKKATLLVYEKV
jgi:hypothetical protein